MNSATKSREGIAIWGWFLLFDSLLAATWGSVFYSLGFRV